MTNKKNRVQCNIHTVEIKSSKEPFVSADNICFKDVFNRTDRNTGVINTYCIINPNNLIGDVWTLSEFQNAFDTIVSNARLQGFCFKRIDLKFDSMEDNYLEYLKLNSLLIGLFETKYKFKNDQVNVCSSLVGRIPHSVFVKNQTMEIEYYNKKLEAQDRYPCKARLEFRACNIRGEKKPQDVINEWIRRLSSISLYYDIFVEKNNDILFQQYKKYCEETNCVRLDGKSLTNFIRENKNAIFSKKQLIMFAEKCCVRNPYRRATNLIKTCHIELISKEEIEEYINSLVEMLKSYMQ